MVFVTGHILVRACASWSLDGQWWNRIACAQGSSIACRLLQTEGESNPLFFSQIFHLAPVGTSYAVSNGASIIVASHLKM